MQNESGNGRLKRLIASAFPNSVLLSHAECEDLRTKLVSLQDEDVCLALGPVLMDLLDTHSPSMGSPDWSDSVVRFLGAAEARPPNQGIPGVFLDTGQMDERAESSRPEAEKLLAPLHSNRPVPFMSGYLRPGHGRIRIFRRTNWLWLWFIGSGEAAFEGSMNLGILQGAGCKMYGERNRDARLGPPDCV